MACCSSGVILRPVSVSCRTLRLRRVHAGDVCTSVEAGGSLLLELLLRGLFYLRVENENADPAKQVSGHELFFRNDQLPRQPTRSCAGIKLRFCNPLRLRNEVLYREDCCPHSTVTCPHNTEHSTVRRDTSGRRR